MSTVCVYPLSTADAFGYAARAGFDGVEVMVTADQTTRSPGGLLALAKTHNLQILAIHTPVLALSQFVWSVDPIIKLRRSAELARDVGAAIVVVHPPFRWQRRYARSFAAIVRDIATEFGVEVAVENLFPWRARVGSIRPYAPDHDPTGIDCDAMTLDFSHASLARRDSLELAVAMGTKLRHVHLCDGSRAPGTVLDEHLVPGRGREPVADVLVHLALLGWNGSVVAEVNTRSARTEDERRALLDETVHFAREHLGPLSVSS